MKLTGAQILMEVLKEEGVDSIFGFPGGATIDIHDNLESTDIRHYLVRHEQGAVHAADGYARVTGKVGVCLVTTTGPPVSTTGVAAAAGSEETGSEKTGTARGARPDSPLASPSPSDAAVEPRNAVERRS